jgi:hypothetical protein
MPINQEIVPVNDVLQFVVHLLSWFEPLVIYNTSTIPDVPDATESVPSARYYLPRAQNGAFRRIPSMERWLTKNQRGQHVVTKQFKHNFPYTIAGG